MSTVGPTLEQALASADARLSDVLDLVDAAIEQAAAESDGALLAGLAERLDGIASERGGEWGALAIAAARARALAGRPDAPSPVPTGAVPTAVAPPAAVSPDHAVVHPPAAVTWEPVPVPNYAGLWRRALAFLLDAAVIGLAATLMEFGNSGSFWPILALAYLVVLPVVSDGATPGKAALGLAIRRADGEKIAFGRSLGRVIVFWLLWATGIGAIVDVILAGTDSKRQSLHDKAAGTIVVRTRG